MQPCLLSFTPDVAIHLIASNLAAVSRCRPLCNYLLKLDLFGLICVYPHSSDQFEHCWILLQAVEAVQLPVEAGPGPVQAVLHVTSAEVATLSSAISNCRLAPLCNYLLKLERDLFGLLDGKWDVPDNTAHRRNWATSVHPLLPVTQQTFCQANVCLATRHWPRSQSEKPTAC